MSILQHMVQTPTCLCPLLVCAFLQPLSRASVSAGGLEAAAAAGVVDEEGAGKHHKQQQHDADIKDEILAHLRLVRAPYSYSAVCSAVSIQQQHFRLGSALSALLAGCVMC
jgi:hypothetical protein